jgi:hypothetical protein
VKNLHVVHCSGPVVMSQWFAPIWEYSQPSPDGRQWIQVRVLSLDGLVQGTIPAPGFEVGSVIWILVSDTPRDNTMPWYVWRQWFQPLIEPPTELGEYRIIGKPKYSHCPHRVAVARWGDTLQYLPIWSESSKNGWENLAYDLNDDYPDGWILEKIDG